MNERMRTRLFSLASVTATLLLCIALSEITLSGMTLSGITVALAQANPPSGSRERELALIIASEGHDCPQIESIGSPPNNEPGWDILRPEVVVCRNGNRFMIVTSGRRNARPIVRPLPSIGERL
jgi:hypothetical protein